MLGASDGPSGLTPRFAEQAKKGYVCGISDEMTRWCLFAHKKRVQVCVGTARKVAIRHSERLKVKNTRFKGGSYESREQGQAQRGADKRFL